MISLRRLVPLVAIPLLLPWASVAQQTPPDGHTINELEHPESVAHGENGAFYAANIGEDLAPSAKDGDGFISRLAADGTIGMLRYLPAPQSDATLHAPKGTVVLDGRLYTADIDRVVGFDLDERTKTAEVSLQDKGVSFLNDVAVFDRQTLLVSASNQGKIYRVDLEAGTATVLGVDVPGANGLTYAVDDGPLYVVSFGGERGGTLWTLELDEAGTVVNTAAQTIVAKGRFDGVVQRPNGTLLISDWGVEGVENPTPALHRVDPSGEGASTTVELSGWEGPADFACAHPHGCWIPDLPASAVHVVHPGERTGK